jgi:hypothetical protein
MVLTYQLVSIILTFEPTVKGPNQAMKATLPIVATCILTIPLFGVVVVDYSGTSMYTPADPGTNWKVDLGGTGTAFDAGTAISPSSEYPGQTFYGAVATSDATAAPLTNWAIYNDSLLNGTVAGTEDWIQLSNSATTTGADKHHYGFILFKQADFLQYSTLAGGVTLDGTTPLSYVIRRTGGSPTNAAFVVQTDAGYFINSPAAITNDQANGNALIELANPAGASWNTYNPGSSIATIGSSANPDLTNVIGIGLWFDNERVGTSTSGMNVNISNISFAAVPEPSTYALLGGCVALGLVLYRRGRRLAALTYRA